MTDNTKRLHISKDIRKLMVTKSDLEGDVLEVIEWRQKNGFKLAETTPGISWLTTPDHGYPPCRRYPPTDDGIPRYTTLYNDRMEIVEELKQ